MPNFRSWEEVKAELGFTPAELSSINRRSAELSEEVRAYREAHPEELLRNAAEGSRAFGEHKNTKLPCLLADWLEAVAEEMEAVHGTEYEHDEPASWKAAKAAAWELLEWWKP